MIVENGFVCYFPKLKAGEWPVDRTWLSYPGPIPEDLPEEFTLEEMEALNIEPDHEGAARAERQKYFIEEVMK